MSIQLIEIGTPTFEKFLEEVCQKVVETTTKKLKAELSPEWVDEAAAMKLLGCKKTKLMELKRKGLIRYATPTKNPLYFRKSILSYIEDHSQK